MEQIVKLKFDKVTVKKTKFGLQKTIVMDCFKIFKTIEEAHEFIKDEDIQGYYISVREKRT